MIPRTSHITHNVRPAHRPAGAALAVVLGGCALDYTVQPDRFTVPRSGGGVAVLALADLREEPARRENPAPLGRIQERLIAGLARKGFAVVERDRMGKLMEEHTLGMMGVVSDHEACNMGRMLGASTVIVGSVTEYRRPLYPTAKLQLTLRAVSIERAVTDGVIEVTVTKSNWFYPLELMDEVVEIAIERAVAAVE